MGIENTHAARPIHWRFFIDFEEDLLRMSRYVEFCETNFSTYSTHLAALLLSAGSEVDVVAKQLCQKLDRNTKAKNIGHYANVIGSRIPQVATFRVEIPRFGLQLQPWSSWSRPHVRRPEWWAAYNNVKHERHRYFSEANLEHTVNAAAGLLILLLYFYREEARMGALAPNPTLFRPEERRIGGATMYDTELLWDYRLNDQ